MSTEFFEGDAGQLVIAISSAVAAAAFAALTGSKVYGEKTTRTQRFIVNLIANAVAHTYTNYVRPIKQKHIRAGNDPKLSLREKNEAEDTAIRYVYDNAKAQGVNIPIAQRQEIRAEVVKEVAKVKAAARTGPSTKGA